MQAANHVEFGGAFADALFGALVDFFEREGVGAGSVGIASESAQLAVGDAHVGGIDVAIDVEIGDVAVAFFAYVIGEPADGEKIGRAIQRDAIFEREALAGENFCGDGFQGSVGDGSSATVFSTYRMLRPGGVAN